MRANIFNSNRLLTPTYVAALGLLVACAAGAGVAAVGSGSPVALAGAVAAVAAAGGAAFAIVYDVPLAALARIAFVASFFIKLDVTVMKIDELEDPSGLNFSLTFVAAVVLWLSDRYSGERPDSPAFPFWFTTALSALTLCAGLSAFYGVGGRLGWFSFASYLSSVFVCWVAASHFGRRDRLVDLFTGIALGVALTGLTALAQFAVGQPKIPFLGTGTEEELLWTQAELFSRVSAFLRTPTEMGWVVSALLPLAVAPVFARAAGISFERRLVFAASALLGVAAVVLSLARGSWIALVVSTLIVVALAWRNWERADRRRYAAAVGGFLVVCAIALAPFAGRIYERLTTDDGESAAIRIPLMQVARNMIESNPLVGVGLSGYRTAMYRFDDTTEHVTQVFPGTVHNSFAHVAAEVGIPGGLLFAFLLLGGAAVSWSSMARGDRLVFALALGAFAALVAYAVSAIKEPGGLGSTRPPVRTLFLLLGMVMAVRRVGDGREV